MFGFFGQHSRKCTVKTFGSKNYFLSLLPNELTSQVMTEVFLFKEMARMCVLKKLVCVFQTNFSDTDQMIF